MRPPETARASWFETRARNRPSRTRAIACALLTMRVETATQRRLGTVAICLATLAQPLDSSVNVAFPDIVNSFHLPIADIQWVVIAYTLTYAALMLVAGRAGD